MDSLVVLFGQMLILVLKVGMPVLGTCLLIGILISVFQVVTQIQEMTLTFVPKVIAAIAVLLVMGHWMINVISNFAKDLFVLASGF
ncbi:flagellar biosynthetic protein FliQ [Catenovulum sediminis]|uniref:flagellar biosynthetic protein FliQ n=1 Tax=Catenovulum sediminis TaxID=1740262 RepID=UPI00117BF2B2|nr:flagellar biosynthetic protein FliQ [Catenovulum sediminis]